MARSLRSTRRTAEVLGVVACALVLAAAVGCGAEGVPKQTDPVLQKGQDLYVARCASCHGQQGEGGTGKRLNGGLVTLHLPKVADHTRIVTKGIAGTSMASWEGVLTKEEIDAVVRYEREVLDKLPPP